MGFTQKRRCTFEMYFETWLIRSQLFHHFCVFLPLFFHLHSKGHLAFFVFAVQSLSHVRLFVAPWTAHQDSMSFTVSQSLLKLMTIESIISSNCLILHHPCLLLPSVFPSIRVFSNELSLHTRWSRYWSFSFSISPCNEYLGLIPFRIDWLDLLAVQRTLKNLLQHHSSKASVLQNSDLFMIQLSHL